MFTSSKVAKSAAMLIICVVLTLESKALSEAEVRAAVETWVRYVTADARRDAVIERMEPYVVNDTIVAYIAELVDSGFCLCGADDLVLPVYFYSPCGKYDSDNPEYRFILWEITVRTRYLRNGLKKGDPNVLKYREFLSRRAKFWHNLIAGRVPPKKESKDGPTMMELDLTSHWHQGSPYNDQCPELTPGADEHCVVGCVATAMSQVMYYWKWPPVGEGDNSVVYRYRWRNNWDEEPLAFDPNIPPGWDGRLEWTPAGGGKLRMNGYWDGSLYNAAYRICDNQAYHDALAALWSRLTCDSTICYANFGLTTYNWIVIHDVHDDPPDDGDAEVAKLCYHAGVAVNMDYGVRGSGAYTSDVADALNEHFRYDPDAVYEDRDIETMTEEIQWLRPVIFRGRRPDSLGGGGHAWIIYGYNKATDPDRQFKMNFGWGGACDGWYSCDSIPCAPFTLNQEHVTYIAPENVVKFVGADDGGDGSPDNPYRDIEEAIEEAPDGAILIFRAGSINTFSGNVLVIDRPFTLKGKDVIIRKQTK